MVQTLDQSIELQWETEILSAFITIIPTNNILQKQLSKIRDDIQTGSLSSEKLTVLINQFIDQFNQQIEGASLPRFELTTGPDNERRTLENYIVAFQKFINTTMRNKLISLVDESPIFKKATQIWEGVLSVRLPIHQGYNNLQDLIQKMNTLLPTQYHYPNIPTQLYAGKQ